MASDSTSLLEEGIADLIAAVFSQDKDYEQLMIPACSFVKLS